LRDETRWLRGLTRVVPSSLAVRGALFLWRAVASALQESRREESVAKV
jgi:hypothetical protein